MHKYAIHCSTFSHQKFNCYSEFQAVTRSNFATAKCFEPKMEYVINKIIFFKLNTENEYRCDL